MVQVMESWFLADREALKAFFGKGFRGQTIPKSPHIEDVPKERVISVLGKATAACGPGKYAKGNLSFSLLAAISPAKVEAASPIAKALFERLRNL